MSNADVIQVLEKLARLMELSGEDGFRVASYRKAARAIRGVTEDLAIMAAQNRLTEIPNVGKGIAARIQQFLSTGHIDVLDELENKFPAFAPALLNVPGLGPKKAALLHSKLGIGSLDDLKKAIESGALAQLPGFGETSVKKIAEGIAFLEKGASRTPLGVALPIAEQFVQQVADMKGVRRAQIAGSLRRGMETIGDIDIVCDADAIDGERIVTEFTSLPVVRRVLANGATKGSITIDIADGQELQIDLRVVSAESFGAALQYFTGSKEHNVKLRERAVAKKWLLNEYGLFDAEKKPLAGTDEAGIYEKLGLPFIPPELREDTGEFSRRDLELVTADDIRGDLHMHTVASDGRYTIEEMAKAARERGYAYIAICDHSKSSTIANGLSIERMREHLAEIRRVDQKLDGIRILAGCECDILGDGTLDYPDEILSQCDWVVASAHSRTGTTASPTERTLAAINNRFVSAIGHPTGRLINRRPAMEVDMPAVVKAAAKNGTALEINASWHRLDLCDVHARLAIEAGVMLTINTDAHHTKEFDLLRYGILTARRAGAHKANVVNCLEHDELRKFIARKRNRCSASLGMDSR